MLQERNFTYRLIRILRVAIPLAVFILIAGSAWRYFARHIESSGLHRMTARLSEGLRARTEGFTFSRTEGGRTLFTIRAGSNVEFQDGRNMLEGVDLIVYGTAGNEPARRIQSKRCSLDQQAEDIRCSGGVDFQFADDTHGHAEELTYKDFGRGLLKLAGGVQVETKRTGFQNLSATAQSGGGPLESPAAAHRDCSVRTGGEAISGPGSEGGFQTWKLRAGSVEAVLSPRGILSGIKTRGSVELAELSGGGREFSGGEIDATFDATGKVDTLEARQSARMVLGANRTLTSDQIRSTASGSIESVDRSVLEMGGSIIEGSDFSIQDGDIISFRTQTRSSLHSPEQSSSADRTEARFDRCTNNLLQLVQGGNFQFQTPRYQGQAQNARFDQGGAVVTLEGLSILVDSQERLEAGQIRLNQKDNSFVAMRNVKTVTNDDERVAVSSARAQGGPDMAQYTGNVQLWVGNTYIKADRLQRSGRGQSLRVHAEGKARAQIDALLLEARDVILTGRETNTIEVNANGAVIVTWGSQSGIGERATYDAAAGSVTLTGKNAEVRDKEHGTHRGARLIMKSGGETVGSSVSRSGTISCIPAWSLSSARHRLCGRPSASANH